tara:strand:+ start:4408 stop:5538 length:1131 start_codon:yes stop_codon:yes gene_type:complete
MILYKILWIDDEYEELDSVIDHAFENQLELIPFKSRKSGMKNLKDNLETYDGVLLDGKFLDKDDGSNLEDTNSIFTLKEILQLDPSLPLCVLTAQKRLKSDPIFKSHFQFDPVSNKKVVFDKTDSLEREEAFNYLKGLIENRPINIVKTKYPSVFGILNDQKWGIEKKDKIEQLCNFVKFLNGEIDFISTDEPRKILEKLLIALQSFNVIPDEFNSLNTKIRFLSYNIHQKKDKSSNENLYTGDWNYNYKSEIIPLNIIVCLNQFNDMSNKATHDNFTSAFGSSSVYYQKSLIYLLFTILSWFKNNENNYLYDVKNQSRWSPKFIMVEVHQIHNEFLLKDESGITVNKIEPHIGKRLKLEKGQFRKYDPETKKVIK